MYSAEDQRRWARRRADREELAGVDAILAEVDLRADDLTRRAAAPDRPPRQSLTTTFREGSAPPWANIIAFGVDAVTVPGASSAVVPDPYLGELAGKPHTLLGKRVLTTAGVQLGTVLDVDFDPTIGRLAALHLEQDPLDAGRLLGVGSYAAIVRA